MIYRDFGKTGLKVSVLGFGSMRLYSDQEQSARIVSRAVELGVNYFDTSHGYIQGTSEVKIGLGIKGKRDKVYLANKCHPSPTSNADGVRKVMERSLQRMGIERFDFYHLWYVNNEGDFKAAVRKGGTLEGIKKARLEGLVDHIGLTTHAPPELIKKMLDSGEFETVTIYYNLINRKCAEIIPYAYQRGIGVIVMGPLGSGTLAKPSEALAKSVGGKQAVIDAAMRYLWANEKISTVLSGVSSISELEANAKAAETAGQFADEDRARALQITREMAHLGEDYCTNCGYCVPCPQGVAIPEILTQLNYYRAYGLKDPVRERIRELEEEGVGPSLCEQCGECEPQCTQQLKITELLEQAKALIEE